jgi:hypothetical protein
MAPQPYDEIRRFLSVVRRRIGFVSAIEGLTFLIVLVLGFSASVILAAWVDDGAWLPWMRWIAAGGLTVFVIGVFIGYIVLPWRRYRGDDAVARHVDAGATGLGNGVISCVQLESEACVDGEPQHFAKGLVHAQALSTATQLRSISPGQLVSWRRVRRMAKGLVVIVLLLSAIMVRFHEPFAEGFRALLTGVSEAQARPRITSIEEREVVVGDITYTLDYPAYTRLPTQVLRNTSGDLRVLVGTKVTIATTSLVPVREAVIVFEGNREAPVRLEVRDSTRLLGKWTVQRSDRFGFEVQTPAGKLVRETVRRTLEATEDSPPKVTLIHPQSDVELHGDEVVKLQYSASDDFGLAEINLVVHNKAAGERPQRRRIVGPKGARTHVGETGVDMRELKLRSGEEVLCWIEAFDNNTVAETPQRARSRVIRIKRHSAAERHRDLVEAQRALLDSMVDLLADRLESSIDSQSMDRFDVLVAGQAKITTKLGRLLAVFQTIVKVAESDPITPDSVRSDLKEMMRRHDELHQGEIHHVKSATGVRNREVRVQHLTVLLRTNETAITLLEQDILLLERVVDRQHQEQLVGQARDLVSAHRELMSLLEKFKNEKDPAIKLQIQKRINRLMRQVEQLMASMKRTSKPMPYENYNLDALELAGDARNLQDMRSHLSKMKKMIRDGKIKDAISMAENMGKKIQSLMGTLEGDLKQMQAHGNSKSAAEIRRVLSDLSKVIHRQDTVHRDAKGINSSYRKKLGDVVRNELAPQITALLGKLQTLNKRLSKVSPEHLLPNDRKKLGDFQQAVEDLKETLSQEDISQAHKMAKKIHKGLHEFEAELNFGLDRLKERAPRSWRVKRRERAVRRVGSAKPMAREVVQDLAKMIPGVDELLDRGEKSRLDRLGELQKKVQERLQRLRGTLDKLERVSPGMKGRMGRALEKASEAMGESEQRLRKHQPGLAESNAREALSQLESARKSLERSRNDPGRGKGGIGGLQSRRRVAIPDADQYRVPKEYRDELLKSIKERAPHAYRELIERYYEALVQ